MKTTNQNTLSGLGSRPEQSGAKVAKALPQINWSKRMENRTLAVGSLLPKLSNVLPDVYAVAEVVGKWVWVEFKRKPARKVRRELAELGFHWNNTRRLWQHPCGEFRTESTPFDPRKLFGSRLAVAKS